MIAEVTLLDFLAAFAATFIVTVAMLYIWRMVGKRK